MHSRECKNLPIEKNVRIEDRALYFKLASTLLLSDTLKTRLQSAGDLYILIALKQGNIDWAVLLPGHWAMITLVLLSHAFAVCIF